MVSIYVILMKELHAITHMFHSILLLVLGRSLLVTMSRRHHEGLLNAFLDTRGCKNWAHKIWKYLIIWNPFCQVFPEYKVLSLLVFTWTFRGVERAAAAAHNLILVEVDGKCWFVGDRAEDIHVLMEQAVKRPPHSSCGSEKNSSLMSREESQGTWSPLVGLGAWVMECGRPALNPGSTID